MELTLKQVVESQEALQHLMDQKLPIKTAFALQRNVRLILQEVENFSQAQSKLIREIGEPIDTPNGEQYQVRPEKREAYIKHIEELLSVKISLDLHSVPLSSLSEVDLTVRDVLLLSYLIEEDNHDSRV